MLKKGVFQLIYLLIILFVVAMIGILFYALSDKILTAYDDIIPEDSIADQTNKIIQLHLPYITDEFVFFMFLGIVITLVIAAAKTNFSPTVIVLFILVLLMAILIASGLVNIFQEFAQSDELAGYSANLTLTNIILGRFMPLIICVLGGIMIMIMYGKAGGDIIT